MRRVSGQQGATTPVCDIEGLTTSKLYCKTDVIRNKRRDSPPQFTLSKSYCGDLAFCGQVVFSRVKCPLLI